jgi:5,10-methylenetetrahydromethanopterin reductase
MTSVGVTLPRNLPAAHLRPYARAVEAAGFDELWVVEDCFFRGGIAQAATALAVTSRVHVGLGILPAAARNPVFTALEVSALAELHPGRVTVGIGHGMPDWMRQVGAWPRSPLTLLEEHLTVVRALLHGRSVTTRGRYVTLDDVRLELPPEVVPPVVAGVRGPRSLAVSGRCADGTVLAEPLTPAYLRAAAAQIAAGQDAPGDHLLVGYSVCAVEDDERAAVARGRRALQWVGEPDVAPHLVGLPFADELSALRVGAGSMEDFADRLPEAWVRELAVVGTPAQARERIAELHDAGATTVVLAPSGPDPLGELDVLARCLSRGARPGRTASARGR